MKNQEVTVCEIVDTKNPAIKKVKLTSPNQSAETTFDILMSGIGSAKAPLTCFQSMSIESIDKLGIVPGITLNEAIQRDCAIRVVETTTPQYEGHNPKTRGANGSICTSGGQPIYRTTELVIGAELEVKEDIKLPLDAEVVTATRNQLITESIGA